ncbi:MAG: Gfo/Idh/MocA family protein [Aestuariibaculum sp.]
MKTDSIKWGIMGLGKIAHKFAKDLQTVPNAQLYAVASRTQEKATDFAETFGAIKAYNTYKALANDPNIDAVYIATPHAYHKANTLLCLENHKAVLCEKPFAMNLLEVETMITKAQEKNVLLMEALWTYFLPHYQYVLKLLQNKTYGRILKLEADFGFYRNFDNRSRVFNKTLGGGSLLDIGIYPIFAALSTLGLPNTIKASATFFDNGADSSCNMVFGYNNGVKAYLKSSLKEELPTQAIFYCENATIKINTQFHTPTTLTIIENGKENTLDFGCKTHGYNFEATHFNHLIKSEKTQSDIMTFEFSKNLIKTLDEVGKKIGLVY